MVNLSDGQILVLQCDCTYPGTNNGTTLLGIDLHIRREGEAGNSDPADQQSSGAQYDNHWIGRWILQPVLLEVSSIGSQKGGGNLVCGLEATANYPKEWKRGKVS